MAVDPTAWVPCCVVVDGALKLNSSGHHVRVWCGAVGVPQAAAEGLRAAAGAKEAAGKWSIGSLMPKPAHT